MCVCVCVCHILLLLPLCARELVLELETFWWRTRCELLRGSKSIVRRRKSPAIDGQKLFISFFFSLFLTLLTLLTFCLIFSLFIIIFFYSIFFLCFFFLRSLCLMSWSLERYQVPLVFIDFFSFFFVVLFLLLLLFDCWSTVW